MGMVTSGRVAAVPLKRAGKDRAVYWSGRLEAIWMAVEVPVLLGKSVRCATRDAECGGAPRADRVVNLEALSR
jgi:hypothetical protein